MRIFKVIPRSSAYKTQAKILEAVLNKHRVADRIMNELAKILRAHAEMIITGYPETELKNDIFGTGKL